MCKKYKPLFLTGESAIAQTGTGETNCLGLPDSSDPAKEE
jgi:hypothetical protein